MTLPRLRAAAAFVRRRAPLRPDAGIILGSGMSDAVALSGAVDIPFGRIPHFPKAGVHGHRGVVSIGRLAGRPVAVLRGRLHYYEGHPPEVVIFPVRLLKMLGAASLVLTNAVGGINRRFRPGDLMMIRDHINFMGMNPLRGPNLDELGTRFPDTSRLYDRPKLGLTSGVYAAVSGPSYETPAEIEMLRRLGADAVGMSVVPEALAAAHMGMRVVGISLITNMAAGISPRPLSHEEVIQTSKRALKKLSALLSRYMRTPA